MSDHESFFAITKTEPIDLDDEDIGLEPGVTFVSNSISPLVKQEYSPQGSSLDNEKRNITSSTPNVGLSLTNLRRLPTLDNGSARAVCPPISQNPTPFPVVDDGVTSLEDYCRLLLRKYHPRAWEIACGECKKKIRAMQGTSEHATAPLSHAILHAQITRYQCRWCAFSCSSLGLMPKHLKERHSGTAMREGVTYIDQTDIFRRAVLNKLIKCYGAYGEDLSDLPSLDSVPAKCTRPVSSIQQPPIKRKQERPEGSFKIARNTDEQLVNSNRLVGSGNQAALDLLPTQSTRSVSSIQQSSIKRMQERPVGYFKIARNIDQDAVNSNRLDGSSGQSALDSPSVQTIRPVSSIQQPPIKRKRKRCKGSSKIAQNTDQPAVSLDQWDGSSDLPALYSLPAESTRPVSSSKQKRKPEKSKGLGFVTYARITDRLDGSCTNRPPNSTSVAAICSDLLLCRANPSLNAPPLVDHQSLFRPTNDRHSLNPTTFAVDSASSSTIQIINGNASLTGNRCEQNRLIGPYDLCLELATKYQNRNNVKCLICEANIYVPRIDNPDIFRSMTNLLLHALEHFDQVAYSCELCSYSTKKISIIWEHCRVSKHMQQSYTARCLGSQHQMMEFVRRCYDSNFNKYVGGLSRCYDPKFIKAVFGLSRPSEVASASKMDGVPTAMATATATGPINLNFAPESNIIDETPIVENPLGKCNVEKMMRRHEPTISMVAKVALERWTKETYKCDLCRLVLRNEVLMEKHTQFCAGKR